METVLLVLLMGGMNLLAFVIGARTAQKADRGEEIKLPSINPVQIYQEKAEQKEAEKEQKRLEIIMDNINNYTGDSTGQKNIDF